jgi:hypothetical protein
VRPVNLPRLRCALLGLLPMSTRPAGKIPTGIRRTSAGAVGGWEKNENQRNLSFKINKNNKL